jgi:sugar lactone lactonase YvrE
MGDSGATFFAELVVDAAAELGEGPIWDPRDNTLYWLDLLGCVLHRYRMDSGESDCFLLQQCVGAIGLRTSGGLVAATRDGFGTWCEDDGLCLIAPVEIDQPGHRMNDGNCDPAGRFWAGAMADDGAPGEGALYSIDAEQRVTAHLDGLCIPNGIDWAPDARTMYLIDSGTCCAYAFSFDVADGTLTDRRVLVQFPDGAGVPDGLTVDAEGNLWIAVHNGWSVHCYTDAGTLLTTLALPVAMANSCTFGGPNLTDLFVTTGRVNLGDADLAAQPSAGGLFIVRNAGRGQNPRTFLG